jgi:hypothetical protein
LTQIAGLSGKPDRYKLLEKSLWESVGELVPEIMSLSDWTQTLQKLREANLNADKATGSSVEEPLSAIRRWLNGEAA